MTNTALKFERCPKAWARDEAPGEVQMIRDWQRFKRLNVLPNGGGQIDQDSRWWDAFDIIEEVYADHAPKSD